MDNDGTFLSTVSDFFPLDPNVLCFLSDKLFQPFDLNEESNLFSLSDIDPDLNYYNGIACPTNTCNYHFECTLNDKIAKSRSQNYFSVFHANVRSVKKNLGSLENYLQNLNHQFTAIALTRTWLQDNFNFMAAYLDIF